MELVASSSVLDEHPVATPQVGSPAFRIMNCRTSQMPMTSRIVPRPSIGAPLGAAVRRFTVLRFFDPLWCRYAAGQGAAVLRLEPRTLHLELRARTVRSFVSLFHVV